jgi:hypothetical protein
MSLVILQTQAVTFNFPASKTSTRKVEIEIDPPPGTQNIVILLQSYNFAYSNGKRYGFGELGVNLATVLEGSAWIAACVATLKDDKRDEREWSGNVVGILQYLGTTS